MLDENSLGGDKHEYLIFEGNKILASSRREILKWTVTEKIWHDMAMGKFLLEKIIETCGVLLLKRERGLGRDKNATDYTTEVHLQYVTIDVLYIVWDISKSRRFSIVAGKKRATRKDEHKVCGSG